MVDTERKKPTPEQRAELLALYKKIGFDIVSDAAESYSDDWINAMREIVNILGEKK